MFDTIIDCLSYLQNPSQHFSTTQNTDTLTRLEIFSVTRLKAIQTLLSNLNQDKMKYHEIEARLATDLTQLSVLRSQPDQTKAFLKLAKKITQAKAARKERFWYADNSKLLTDQNFWQSCIAQTPEQQSTLNRLKDSWQTHGNYASFSTPDLIFIYISSLRQVSDWLTEATHVLQDNQDHLTFATFIDYQDKLQQIDQHLAAEKLAIRAALLTRLAIALNKSDLRYDDFIVDTVEQLKLLTPNIKIITDLQLPKHPQQHLTPDLLSYIRMIISIDGDLLEKTTLASLVGCHTFNIKDNPSIPLHLSATSHKITTAKKPANIIPLFKQRQDVFGIAFIIPENVKKYVPKKPPFYTKLPTWLHIFFPATKTAYEFFQDVNCQYLLLAEQALQTRANLKDSSKTFTWDYLVELMQLLETEEKRFSNVFQKLNKVLHANTQQALKHYQVILKTFAQNILYKQIENIQQQIADLEKMAQDRSLSDREKIQLEDQLDTMQQFKQTWRLTLPYESYLTDLVLRGKHLINEPPFETLALGSTNSQEALPLSTEIIVKSESETKSALLAEQYSQLSFGLNHRVNQQQQILQWQSTLKQEFARAPLSMASAELVQHIQTIQNSIENLKPLSSKWLDSYTFQSGLYEYLQRLLEAIQSLPEQTAFTPLEGHVQLILQSVKNWITDITLQQMAEQLLFSLKNYKSSTWNSWINNVIKPNLEALTQATTCFQESSIVSSNSSLKK